MNQQLFHIAVFIFLTNICSSAFSQPILTPAEKETELIISNDEPDESINEPEGMFDAVIGRLDITHTSISSRLEETASSIDAFFADDIVFEQTNQSYMRVALDMVSKEYNGTGFAGDLKIKVDLPQIKKRLNLLIESDSQRDSKDDLEEIPANVVQERDFFISLERKLSGAKRWDIRPSLGVKVRSPIDPFARMRTFRYFSLDNWLVRASNSLTWYDSRGYDVNGALEFDRAIKIGLLFRTTSKLSWQEEDMFRRFEQTISLYQSIDARQSIAYQIAGFADDEFDWRSNQYYMRARYRKNLYKKWMFGEIIPQLTFLKEADFHNEISITFRLEMVFGESYR